MSHRRAREGRRAVVRKPASALALVLVGSGLLWACRRDARSPSRSEAGAGRATLGAEFRNALPDGDGDRTYPMEPAGVEIAQLADAGPALRAGLAVGDRVVTFDGRPLRDVCEMARGLSRLTPGGTVRLTAQRRGQSFGVEVRAADGETLYRTACEAGQPIACRSLAYLILQADESSAQTWSESGALYARACDGGDAEGCAQIAGRLIGDGNPEELARAVDLSQRACERGSASGCAHLAYLYATGVGLERDDTRATLYYGIACEAGEAEGCYNVGLMTQYGRGVPSDAERAARAYRRGCELGSSMACTNIGYFHEIGTAVAADAGRAARLYGRGCEGACGSADPTACFNLGVLLSEGRGVEKDDTRAAQLFERACSWPVLGGGKGAPSAGACNNLGSAVEAGRGVAADPERAARLYQRACELGSTSGCRNARAHRGG